jgi:hypothetical protein
MKSKSRLQIQEIWMATTPPCKKIIQNLNHWEPVKSYSNQKNASWHAQGIPLCTLVFLVQINGSSVLSYKAREKSCVYFKFTMINRYFEAGQIRLYSIQYLESFNIMMYKLIETVLSLGVLGLDIRNTILEKPWSTVHWGVQSSPVTYFMSWFPKT